MRSNNIEPKSAQFVHAHADEPAGMVLAEGVKGAGPEIRILPPLVLYERHGCYTKQALSLFQSL
jgi:tRNA1Val (adenine37-N6)-methyltransferase